MEARSAGRRARGVKGKAGAFSIKGGTGSR